MAFIWNDESLALLCENAGVLSTQHIAQMLCTNVTVVRNMAYRLKLSLRVSAYNQKRIQQVQALYESDEPLTLKEIAVRTGLTFSTVQYIVYVKLKHKPYATREFIAFETQDAVHYRVQKRVCRYRAFATAATDGQQPFSGIVSQRRDSLLRA
ncbi:hypothetical protein PYX06_14590 [Citrobacter amalonaticus]|nr:hypothetical protein [Citrobacter amalonaticus]